jgi:hypothetical protein
MQGLICQQLIAFLLRIPCRDTFLAENRALVDASTNLHRHNLQENGRERAPHLALNFPGVFVVDGAANANACAQDLLDSAGQLACAAAVAHDASDLDHLVQLQVATVLDVLLLQAQEQHTVGHRHRCPEFGAFLR